MPKVGERVRLASRKVGQDPRSGVITGVRGQMISVRWSSGEESSIVPGPGTLTVVGRATARPKAAKKKKKAAPARKKATRRAAPARKKAVPSKKPTATKKKAPARKKAPAKKAAKRPGRRR